MSAWLSTSFSELTDQLSSLAKLTEPSTEDGIGSQPVSGDHQKEVEELRAAKEDLQQQVEAIEGQLMTVSEQYRQLLREKEEEVQKLQFEVRELSGQRSLSEQEFAADIPVGTSTPPSDAHSFDYSFPGAASADSLSREQLQIALNCSRAECSKWQKLAQSSADDRSTKEEDNIPLLHKVKELEELLSTEAEQHQEQLSILQQLHTDKTQALQLQHEQDLARLADRVKELEAQRGGAQLDHEREASLENGQSDELPDEIVGHSEIHHTEQELSSLQEQLQSLQAKHDAAEKQIACLQGQVAEYDHNSHMTSGLKEQWSKQSAHLEQLNALVKKKDEEITGIMGQLQDATVQCSHYKKEASELREQLCTVQQRLVEQLDAEKARSIALSADLEQLRHSVSEENRQHLEMVRQERELVCQQLEDAHQTVSTQRQELTLMQEERRRLVQELDELQKAGEAAASEEITAALLKEKESLRADCELLKLQLAETSEELEETRADAERSQAKLEEELVRLRERLKEETHEDHIDGEGTEDDKQNAGTADQAVDVQHLTEMHEKRVQELMAKHLCDKEKLREQHEKDLVELENRLDDDIQHLQLELASSHAVVNDLKQKQDLGETLASQQSVTITALKSQIERMERENSALSQENEELKAWIASTSAKDKDDYTTELEALQAKVAEQETALSDAKQQLADMTDLQQKTADSALHLRNHLEQLSSQHDSELLELASDRDALAEQASELQTEIKLLKSSTLSSDIQTVDNRSSTIPVTAESNQSKQCSKEELQQTLDDTSTLKKMEELQARLTELVAEKESRDERLASVTKERDLLKEQQAQFEGKHTALLHLIDSERNTHQQVIVKMSNEKEALLAESRDALQKEAEQQKLLRESNAQLRKVEVEAARWQRELSESTSEVNTLRRKLAEEEAESANSLHALQQQAEEVKSLHLLLARQKLDVENTEELTKQLSSQELLIDQLKEKLQSSVEELSAVQAQLLQAKTEALSDQSVVKRLREELNETHAKNEQEREELRASLQEQLESHQQQLSEKTCHLEELLAEYGCERNLVAEQGNTIKQLQSELEEAQQVAAEHKERLAKLQVEHSHNVDQHHYQLEEVERKCSELQNEMESLHQDKLATSKVVDQLRSRAEKEEELKLSLEVIQAQLLSCQAEKDAALSQLDDNEKKLALLRDEVKAACSKVVSLEKSSNTLQQTNGQLSQQLADRQKALYTVQEELSATRAELAQSTAAQQELQEQLETGFKEADDRSQRELQRLRQHLVQIGDQHTQELIAAEKREEELFGKVADLQLCLQQSSAEVEAKYAEYADQIEQLNKAVKQSESDRDQVLEKWRASEDRAHSNAEALSRLQLVLEQFQTEHEDAVKQARLESARELDRVTQQMIQLQEDANKVQIQLDQAHRLENELQQLQVAITERSRQNDQLQSEVCQMQATLAAAEEQIEELRSSSDNKVDRNLVKNLLLSYLTAPAGRRDDVLKPVASIFGFTGAELSKVSQQRSSWLKNLWASPTHSQQPPPEKSFTELFVEFLENESTPHDSSDQRNVASSLQLGSARHLPILPALTSLQDGKLSNSTATSHAESGDGTAVEGSSTQPSPTTGFFLPGVTSAGSAPDSNQSATLRNILDEQ